jgi:hypothetical protein
MAFLQRLYSLGFVPIVALLALQLFAPEKWHELQDIVEPYLAGTAFSHIFPHPLPPRSQTPILFAATSHSSHVDKISIFATELAALGYPITFLTGRSFEKQISSLHKNIKFVPFLGPDGTMSEADAAEYMKMPSGPEQELFIMKKVFVDMMPTQHETIQTQLQSLRKKWGKDRPLIFIYDQTATGYYPVMFGAPGLKADVDIAISLAPLTLPSNDTFPFRTGKLPHTGPDAKKIHEKAYEENFASPFVKSLNEEWWSKLRESGAVQDPCPGAMEAMNIAPEHIFALGIPEFEFPRSDIRSNIYYVGALKKSDVQDKEEEKGSALPEWWGDIAKAKKEGKMIVAVSQGTVEGDLTDLVLPTIEALKDQEKVLLIATTVLVDPKDVPNLIVPANTRVEKYIPFDLLLPLVSKPRVIYCLRLGVLTTISSICSSATADTALCNTV